MKKNNSLIFGGIAVAIAAVAMPVNASAEVVTGWGDFKLYLDPGHEGRSNQGLWGYSEAEKVLDVALNIKQMLETYTDISAENLKLCRLTEQDNIGLSERSDEANAWGADFYYSIHSDAGSTENTIVTLFGGWRNNGVEIEKTPNGGKAYGEILNPNMAGVMRVGTRGNWHDRCFYDRSTQTHANQYPYLSVNRESNMPSLLSEGAYHTIQYQQGRNLNAEYRRLEAFAAFQSLLKYHGMDVPAQTFLHGEVYNSENDQRINGATVTVDGKTYTTDTWEGLFNKYTKNSDLIHNGLYTFEGLEAGKEYVVTFSAPGYDSRTEKVTIKSGGENSGDFVTFLDVALTNNSPAVVSSISIENAESVSPIYPVTLTFSRNMNRETVENAFSVNNDGKIDLKWINDYTLELDLSKLVPLWDYTITIDGSIAKNSQTDQFFDGDADGEPGGNWVYSFTMAEPDLTAPVIVSTYPKAEGEVVMTEKFPVRIEFDEEINWNEDKNADCVSLTDKDGTVYTGTTTHAVVNGHSVLHFYSNTDLPKDHTILVTVAPGLADMSGNVTTEPSYFRFMTEYRSIVGEETVLLPLSTTDGFWTPSGSGSSEGLINDDSYNTTMNSNPFSTTGTSLQMHYVFDESYSQEKWFVRLYTPSTTSLYSKDYNVVISFWVYGDRSNNTVGTMVRIPNTGGGLKAPANCRVLDFAGWEPFHWDLMNDEYTHFTGDQVMGASGRWFFDSFTLKHEYTDPDDEDIAQQAWEGDIAFNKLSYAAWDTSAERQASLSDIDIPSAVNDIVADNSNVTLAVSSDLLTIKAGADILKAEVYGVDGMQVAVVKGHDGVATAAIGHLNAGVYIVNVTTTEGITTHKFVK